VHGGGFYHNQKYQVAPAAMPEHLHWFKWEAYFTWISGFSLLVLIYYVGARSYLIDPEKAALSPAAAIGIGLAAQALGWLVYDRLCRLLRSSNLELGLWWFTILLFAAIALNGLFNSRAAYLHVGAMIGTVMVANVFFIIIPNQRKVVADLIAGRTPDPALGAAAKQRSLHNNYMTLPVLFIMISNHYPMTYGAQRPWLVLALLGLTGVAIRHVFNLRGRGRPTGPTIGVAIALALASVTYVTLEKGGGAQPAPGPAVTYAEIQPILATHCAACHSPHPANPAFRSPPLGLVLDSYEHVSAASARIRARAVDTETMPLGNATHMTKAERQKLGAWIAAGTPR
jgi:uncharacterized membrane protein